MEMREGHILWLREYKDIEAAFASEYPLPHMDIYNHPVLIVRAFEGGVARVCVLTSSPNSGGDFFRCNIAIFPQNSPHPDLPQLHLLNGVQLRTEDNGGNGYLNTRQTHLVHRRMLNPICRSDEPEDYCLTRGRLAMVRSLINEPLPPDVELRHLSEGAQSVALRAEMAKLKTVMNKLESENRSLRALGSEIVALRQIEGEVARLRPLYPEDESLRVLEHFIDWKRRVGAIEDAGANAALVGQSLAQGRSAKVTTTPAEPQKGAATPGESSPLSAPKPTAVGSMIAWFFGQMGQP